MISHFRSIKLKNNHKFKKNYKHSFVYRVRYNYKTWPNNVVFIRYYNKDTKEHCDLFLIEKIDVFKIVKVEVVDFCNSKDDVFYVSFSTVEEAKKYVLKNIDYCIKRINYSFLD